MRLLTGLRIEGDLLLVTLRRLLVSIMVPLVLHKQLLLPFLLSRILNRLKAFTVNLLPLLIRLLFECTFDFFTLVLFGLHF